MNPFRFKGYYFDSESGMYYCNSRYYVPDWERWLNCDNPKYLEFKNIVSLNLYCYCNNDPINHYDKNGKFWFTVMTTVVGAVVGATEGVVFHSIGSEIKKDIHNFVDEVVDYIMYRDPIKIL